jgi:hypothetical protein
MIALISKLGMTSEQHFWSNLFLAGPCFTVGGANLYGCAGECHLLP